MSEAVVLGSGTSNGVPTLGIRYAPEFLANPKNHRTRPSLLLRGPGGNVLVDCAPEMRLQLLREQVYDLSAVIVTHTHADHVMGMDDVRAFCLKNSRKMPIYASAESQADIRRIFGYAFADFPPGIWVPRFELRDPQPVLELCGLSIQTMPVFHGPAPVLALRVNDFAYVTDVSEIPGETWERLQGLDVLMLDAVRYAPHPNHYHFDRAIEVAQALGARTTYFTHLSDDYDHDRTEAALPEGIHLAYDGLRISL